MPREEKLCLGSLAEGYEVPAAAYTMPFAEAMAEVERSVSEHVMGSAYLRGFLGRMLKGPGTSCPDSPVEELQKYAAVRRSEMDMSDPEVAVGFMSDVQRPMFQFWRRAVMDAVRGHADEGVRVREPFINLGMLAASLVDDLWVKWFRDVCLPYQKLDDDGQKRYVEQAKSVLSEFDYTVFDYHDGEFADRRTFAEAYPHTVGMLVATLVAMSARAPEPQNALHLQRLAEAYECRDIGRLEDVWAEVDRAFIAIPGNCPLFAVHGMENGYSHPFCVSPELRLTARATSEDDMVMIERFRGETPIYAEAAGLPTPFVDVAEQKMSRMDVGVFVSVTESGENMQFRYTGQVVPNRQAILAQGGKTFIAQQSLTVNAEMMRGKVRRHCAPETAEIILPNVREATGFMHTVGHELGHPVGCTPEVDTALGDDKTLLEEAKASAIGVLVAERLDPSPENRLEIVSALVARIVRFMDRSELDNKTFAAYVRENLVMATVLFKAGVMEMTPNGLRVDPEAAMDDGWVVLLRDFVENIVLTAYRLKSNGLLELGTAALCDRGPDTEVARLIEWVNRGK